MSVVNPRRPVEWRSRALSAAVSLFVFVGALLPVAAAAGEAPMTLNEIRSLLFVGEQDATLAAAIQRRGLAFVLERETWLELARSGAGPLSSAALEARLKAPSLLVETEPGAIVVVAGQKERRADAAGKVAVSGLPVGRQEVTVRKQGYRDRSARVELRRGEQAVVRISLAVAPAQVVLAGVAVRGATVKIDGLGVRATLGQPFDLEAGWHEVTVECPLCTPFTKRVELPPGQTTEVVVHLQPDSVAVKERLNAARQELERGRTDGAARSIDEILGLEPENVAAMELAALTRYFSDDYGSFPEAALAAVERGAILWLPVRHRDSLLTGLDDGVLALDKQTISARATHDRCTWANWSYRLDELKGAHVETDDATVWLSLDFGTTPSGERRHVRVADRGATLEQGRRGKSLGGLLQISYTGSVMKNRRGASSSLAAIADALNLLRDGASSSSLDSTGAQTSPPAASVAADRPAPEDVKGAVLDRTTGLMWTVNDNGSKVDWDQANAHCETLSLGGLDDWRLPSVDEVVEIFVHAPGGSSSANFGSTRIGLYLSSCCIWTSTPDDEGRKQFFSLASGDPGRILIKAIDLRLMRAACVRGAR